MLKKKKNKMKYLNKFNRFYKILHLLIFATCVNPKNEISKIQGEVFGTYFQVSIYQDNWEDKITLQEIDSVFTKINQSISTYQENSLIAKYNQGEKVELDEIFLTVFNESKILYDKTEHYFNPAIEPLLKAYQKEKDINVKKYLDIVNFDQIMLKNENEKFYLEGDGIHQLNFNAIGKGLGVQYLADFLVQKKLNNFIVEIGGELVIRGKKGKEFWKIGIEKPMFEKQNVALAFLELSNIAVATSGSYRQFIEKNHQKLSHIIDPNTGLAFISELISVTVLHENCAIADAYATALMAMGKENALNFVKKNKNLPVFFIFQEKDAQISTVFLNFTENGFQIPIF